MVVSHSRREESALESRQADAEAAPPELVVAYCTMGLRSGNYCSHELVKRRGYSLEQVRNGEGNVIWTHLAKGRDLMCEQRNVAGSSSNASTRRVHCFGQQWADMASKDNNYTHEVFTGFDFLLVGLWEVIKGWGW